MKIQVGEQYGRWKVLEVGVKNPNSKAKNPPNMAYCECQCEKHTKKYLEYRALYEGRSLSCGCYRGEQLTIRNKNNSSVKIGNKYGRLTVIEDLGFRMQKRGRQESWYLCSCECGNEHYEVNGNNLQSGAVISCGCISSRGEHIIAQIFRKNNINFIQQYSDNSLLSDKGNKLRFDFAILDNDNNIKFLIEFDGRQHYFGPEASWTQGYSLEDIQKYDNLKNKWCREKNIALKRIPFDRINTITIENLLDDTFLLKEGKVLNDLSFE